MYSCSSKNVKKLRNSSKLNYLHIFPNISKFLATLRTDSELEAVSCVRVDVFQCFLHGQSEQDQLTEVMPAILVLLRTGKVERKE